MKLSFRGIKYEYKLVQPEVAEEEISGMYRGAPSKIHHYLQRSRRRQYAQEMIYRGVHYRIS
jgi:hypothetical protein